MRPNPFLNLPFPNSILSKVSEQAQAKALNRTEFHLREIKSMQERLGLLPEHLPLIHELYVRELHQAHEAEEMARAQARYKRAQEQVKAATPLRAKKSPMPIPLGGVGMIESFLSDECPICALMVEMETEETLNPSKE